jgi:mannitol/fructose-specific phosphotransferase system IIA component (Ntr-type)
MDINSYCQTKSICTEHVSKLLPYVAVDFNLPPLINKDRLIYHLAQLLSKAGKILSVKEFVEAVTLRETMGPTYLSNQLAFPHAKSPAVKSAGIAYGRSTQGIIYETDKETAIVKACFLFALPQETKTEVDQLHLISDIAALIIQPDFQNELLKADNYKSLSNLLVISLTKSN